jgi:hypothetical protein
MNATHNVKVGQIFEMSWGYDQTNVNYFQVVSVTAKGVYVREVGAHTVPGSEGRDCCNVTPNKDHFLDRSQWCGGYNEGNPPTFRRIQFSGGRNGSPEEPYFNFKGRYFARPVAATETTYCSWYH